MKNKKQKTDLTIWFALGVAAIGVLIRTTGLKGDFWLDEVWSWQLARAAKSIPGIFLELRHDSNHFLMTLAFYLIGLGEKEWVYRLPPLIASAASLVLAYVLGARYTKSVGLAFVSLLSLSYPFIHYATEARGYSFMFFFSLAAYYCALRTVECEQADEGKSEGLPPGMYAWSLLLGVTCMGGFLSHLSFLYTFIGISGWLAGRRIAARGAGMANLAAQLLLPSVFLLFLYFTNIKGIKVGGAPETDFLGSLYEMFSVALGMYSTHWLAIPLFMAIVGWAVGTAKWTHSEKYFFIAMAVAPLIIWTLSPDTPPYPRHFLPLVLFSFLPLSIWMERIFRKSWGGRQFAMAVALAAWLFGNTLYFSDFARFGRGQYSAAIIRMLSDKPGMPTSVSSDHDFRNSAMLDYYVHRIPGGEKLRYIARDNAATDVPDWVILHLFNGDPTPAPDIGDKNHNTFRMENIYRSAYLSGWSWALYKRSGKQTDSPVLVPVPLPKRDLSTK